MKTPEVQALQRETVRKWLRRIVCGRPHCRWQPVFLDARPVNADIDLNTEGFRLPKCRSAQGEDGVTHAFGVLLGESFKRRNDPAPLDGRCLRPCKPERRVTRWLHVSGRYDLAGFRTGREPASTQRSGLATVAFRAVEHIVFGPHLREVRWALQTNRRQARRLCRQAARCLDLRRDLPCDKFAVRRVGNINLIIGHSARIELIGNSPGDRRMSAAQQDDPQILGVFGRVPAGVPGEVEAEVDWLGPSGAGVALRKRRSDQRERRRQLFIQAFPDLVVFKLGNGPRHLFRRAAKFLDLPLNADA
jgi:hypothetical protein